VPTEIVIETEDRPGILAAVGELFGEIDVNITAAAAFTHGGLGVIHFVVDESDRAVRALEQAGYKVLQIREVLAVSLDDRPGELGRFARRLADAGVNISSFYTTGEGAGDKEIIIAVNNIEAASGVIP
jgi:hypothetical protein